MRRYFRAQTEDDRLEWAKRLVANIFVSHREGRKSSAARRVVIE